MNRYDAEGLIRDMRKGRRIIAVYGTSRDTREAFESTASLTSDCDVKVRRANGAERIEDTHSGGFIRFTFAKSKGQRGLSADILFIDDAEISEGAMCALIPSLQSSPHAEVLRR